MYKSASRILYEAAAFIEKNGLGRGQFFSEFANRFLTCPHGAIAYCADNVVRAKADLGLLNEANNLTRDFENSDVQFGREARKNGLTVSAFLAKKYGQIAVAHYHAIKVGLSHQFNDDVSTTCVMVVERLRIAALNATNDLVVIEPKPKKLTGFALLSAERRKEIAKAGIRQAQANGTANKLTVQDSVQGGRIGGKARVPKGPRKKAA